MRRALSLSLPNWAIDRARRRQRRSVSPPDLHAAAAPLVLVRTVADRQVVAHRCPRCAAAGIKPGQSLAHARALLGDPALQVMDHDPRGDMQALHALAAWATRYLPAVQPDPLEQDVHLFAQLQHPPGLLADITGCQRLYHGEANLLHLLRDLLVRYGFLSRVSAAPSYGAAWALARFHRKPIVTAQPEDLDALLADLPVAALRVEEDVIEELNLVGVETIRQLQRLPRWQLPARFGDDLLLRLDQARGEAIETIRPVRPQPLARAQRQFNGPVKQLEAIQLATRQLIGDLCDKLRQREQGARQVQFVVERSDLPDERIMLTVSHPSRDAKHFWSLLAPKLETLQMGFGVESLTLTAPDAAGLAHEQGQESRLGADTRRQVHEQAAAQVIDTLSNRLGRSQVLCVAASASHVPEQVFRYAPAADVMERKPTAATLVRADRPSRLFDPPAPVQAWSMTPDGPVLQFTWQGQPRQVVQSFGPERITPPWWQGDDLSPMTAADPPARDYFKVQDDTGRWWWLYRHPAQARWFVHGEWT